MMRHRRLEYFVIGMFVGTASGILIGLLFAPDSGVRTRQRLANEALRVADTARVVADRAERAAELVGSRMDHYLGREEEVVAFAATEFRKREMVFQPKKKKGSRNFENPFLCVF